MIHVRLTAASIEWLCDHKVFFHSKGHQRLRPGDVLEFREDCQVEPYVGVFAGFGVCPFGFQSLSYSPLPPKLTVGRYCSIAPGVDAHLATHPLDHVSTAGFTHDPEQVLVRSAIADDGAQIQPAAYATRRHPIIEHDVWIGARAMILPGVTVSTGAVVAAGSVVTRDVGPYEIVAGNPARLIRRRFDEDLVAALLASEWWRYRFTDLVGLPFDEPKRFVEAFSKRKEGLEPYEPAKVALKEMPAAA